MDVLRRMDDGTYVLGWAHWSHRRGPIGEWVLGGKTLADCQGVVVALGPWAGEMFRLMQKGEASAPPSQS